MIPIPVRTDYRMRHTPLANYLLIGVNLLVFLMGYNAMTAESSARIATYMLQAGAPQLHQFFTSVFLHGGWWHLLGNMLFLWVFGNALNDRLGHVAYLAFYLAGGVLASVGYLLLTTTGSLLGASGAIAAVTGAYLVLFPRVRVFCYWWFLYMIIPVELSSLYFLAFQFIYNLVLSGAQAHGAMSDNVAYMAHSSGYAFGIVVAALLLVTRLLPRDPYDLPSLLRQYLRRTSYRRTVARGADPFVPGGRVEPGSKRWVEAKAGKPMPTDGPQAREVELRRQIAEATSRADLAKASEYYLELIGINQQAVLSWQAQLDIANHFMSAEQYPQAAQAYERLIAHYPNYENLGDIYLMLGIVYGRYLKEYEKAQKHLKEAISSLRDPRKIDLARSDLEALRHE